MDLSGSASLSRPEGCEEANFRLGDAPFGRIIARFFVVAAVVAAFSLPLRPALAADLPAIKGPPAYLPPPVAAYDWTGFYAGVNAGYGIDHFGFPYMVTLPGGVVTGTSGITSTGGLVGGQIGFNYQLNNLPIIGHAVVGVELDDQWAGISGSTNVPAGPFTATLGTRFQNFGTLRGRIGYNFDRLLLYVTGGLTYGTTKSYYSVAGFSGSRTETHTGLPFRVDVVGIGAEYALTNHVSIKAEYLYDCVVSHYENFSFPGGSIGFNSRTMYHIARVGLNYKFDWFTPTPVVAKY
jgi:outer membrane immunogenic protein